MIYAAEQTRHRGNSIGMQISAAVLRDRGGALNPKMLNDLG